jgi:predicted transcriptional regulator of viral defense system
MNPRLTALAAQQHGLFTVAQAVEAGYSRADLRSRTSPLGPWSSVRRGVYVERELWEDLPPLDQWRLRDRAASMSMVKGHVLSHDSAARQHGLPMLNPRHDLTHITRPGVGGSRTEHGVRHHLGRERPPHNEEVDGLTVTALARTALDLAREHGYRAGVVACDAAMRRGVTQADFAVHLGPMRRWPHVRRARAASSYADPRAESVLESLGRIFIEDLGLGTPWPQFPLRIGDQVIWLDLVLGCQVFEMDGRVKYRLRERGGVADEGAEAAVWDEKVRERLVRGEGLAVTRLVWDDMWGAARLDAAARMRAEYAITCRQLGTRTPDHLVEFALRHPYETARLPRG